MSHGLQDLEHGNISGGQPGFGGPCPEGRGDTDQSSVQERSCQTRGVKWSGAHGNLKHCQGLEEARASRNSGTDLGLLSRTQTWRGCQGTRDNKTLRDYSTNKKILVLPVAAAKPRESHKAGPREPTNTEINPGHILKRA